MHTDRKLSTHVSCLLAAISFACVSAAQARDKEIDKSVLGCVVIKKNEEEILQNWCDISPNLQQIPCFDLHDGKIIQRDGLISDAKVMSRMKPGEGACDTLPKDTPDVIILRE